MVLTDVTFGFDTALGIATEAIDRLHSTAHSHHRIIVVEIMGNKVGWLALGAGIAGGADVILIPEIPYDVEQRRRSHPPPQPQRQTIQHRCRGRGRNLEARSGSVAGRGAKGRQGTSQEAAEAKAEAELEQLEAQHAGNTMRLAKQLEELTSLESRVTILGYVQRGGTPSAADRLLATRLGTACADLIHKGQYGVMVAARGEAPRPCRSKTSPANSSRSHSIIHGSPLRAALERAWGIDRSYGTLHSSPRYRGGAGDRGCPAGQRPAPDRQGCFQAASRGAGDERPRSLV